MSRSTVAVAALALATTIGAVCFRAYSGPAGVDRTATPPVGVFRDGGIPRSDEALERAMTVDLPALFEALQGGSSSEDKLAYLREHPGLAGHGPGVARAWRAMIDSVQRWWRVSTSAGPRYADAVAELRSRVETVNDQLFAQQLGYYLVVRAPLDEGERESMAAYRIEEVVFVRTNERRVRVLGARRLGAPGSPSRLGTTFDDELDDPIVAMDAVEDKVDRDLLPVLGDAGFAIQSEDGWVARSGARPLSVAAGFAIRRELIAALYDDASTLERAMLRTRKLLAASVRRHEAHHRLDQDSGLPHPEVLAVAGSKRSAFAVRARLELSAYLGQIASDVWLPQLTLWNLSRHAFRRGTVRREEALVAIIVAESLGRELGIRTSGPVLRGMEIDRDRLASLMIALGDRTTAELRSAAAAAWQRTFGRPLARVYD